MAEQQKQTIYIDVDDEITSIVEKVRDAEHKIVALVLPKRMATLQSIVNMKLLKRTADEANKKIVLITSEASLLPLAGAVKLHVAKTLQSKPAIPPPPDVGKAKEIVAEDTGEDTDSDEVDKTKSVGELAGGTAVAAAAKDDIDEDTIDVDSIDDEPAPKDKGKEKKNKLKVPNFDKFRTRLIIAAAGLILLIILMIVANKVLPKAKVVIKTNSVEINANLTITANTDQEELNEEDSLVPATKLETTASSTQQVTASGKKNVGEKASGDVTMSKVINGCSSAAQSVPSGSTITNGVVSFVTTEAANFSVTGFSGGNCTWTSNSVSVTATSSGSKYNVSPSNFSVSGYSGYSASNSAAFSGGTDKTITVVSQADIDTAKQKASQDSDDAKNELIAKFKEQNLFGLAPTIKPSKQTVNSSAKVGEEATNVSVTVETEYSMLGVKQEDLEKLINNYAKDQIDIEKQKISDYGLDKATIVINSAKSATNQTMSIQTVATAGASIDTEALKKDMAGKKSGDVKQQVSELPSVEDVTVDYSPFWVTKAPGDPSKIIIEVQNQQASGNDQ